MLDEYVLNLLSFYSVVWVGFHKDDAYRVESFSHSLQNLQLMPFDVDFYYVRFRSVNIIPSNGIDPDITGISELECSGANDTVRG